jgi:hypothetical protein
MKSFRHWSEALDWVVLFASGDCSFRSLGRMGLLVERYTYVHNGKDWAIERVW